MATADKTKKKKTTASKTGAKKSATKRPAKKAKSAKNAELKTKKKAASDVSATPKPKRTGPAIQRRPLMEKTFFAKPGQFTPQWRLIDATGLTLGRLSTYIATALMGKDKPTYTRSADTGDFIVVINAEKVVLTGAKWRQKMYYHHTGYAGGIKERSAEYVREHHPERLLEKAVWRMLPSGHMGRHWFSKLKIYAGAEHPHKAQQPQPVTLATAG